VDAQSWFESHTSSIDEWSLSEVCGRKDGQRVSVVLPALNEEATIGEIVACIRDDLMPPTSFLVDELLVVDSGSRDDTSAIASRAGARVVRADWVGKGEAMWQGLAASDGDLVVFLDADLRCFDSRFVTALLGPLLMDPGVSLVKATYNRSETDDRGLQVGGGRVTELMARPLIATFWPDLLGVLQPLSGEYAARRSLLRMLPFPCGYGVDLGLLIDTYRLFGLRGIAQVDLHRRWHRHSDLASLGRMATEILHAALTRLRSEGRRTVDLPWGDILAQPAYLDGHPTLEWAEVVTGERPPLEE
jgi:glucosyl-3-phosphoglycerate synthase